MKRALFGVTMALLAMAPAACKRDASVPSARENNRLDSASNLLDQAPNALETVDQRLPEPEINTNAPAAEAHGASQP